MEPGTRFCPNHPDMRFQTFSRECSVCNQELWTHPIPEISIPTPEEEEIISRRMLEAGDLSPAAPEIIETLEEPPSVVPFSGLRPGKKAPAKGKGKN